MTSPLLMIDSAYPLAHPHAADVTLIYAGGNTPHPWTKADIAAVETGWLWPCWVRNNPGGAHTPSADAARMLMWLHDNAVPKGTCTILDLETTVAPTWVQQYDALMVRAGYTVAKYGSLGFIFRNPRTSGGTFVAAPKVTSMVTTGDTVATQFEYDGTFDLSWVLRSVPLWPNPEVDMPLTADDKTWLKGTLADAVASAVGTHVVNSPGDTTVNGVLRRADKSLPEIKASLVNITKNMARQADPAAVAAAIISQLATAGFTADEIAQHILSGLPPTLAQQVAQSLLAQVEQALQGQQPAPPPAQPGGM